jgi:hypothetical protein
MKALETGTEAAGDYLKSLEPILEAIKSLNPLEDWLLEEASKGSGQLLDAFKVACEKAFIEQVW